MLPQVKEQQLGTYDLKGAALKHVQQMRNVLSLPRVQRFDETRSVAALRAIKSLAQGSAGHLPGATSRDIRDAVATNLDSKSLVELLSPHIKDSARMAALRTLHALTIPDLVNDEPFSWRLARDTSRQELSSHDPTLVGSLVTLLQIAVARQEAATACSGEKFSKETYHASGHPQSDDVCDRSSPPIVPAATPTTFEAPSHSPQLKGKRHRKRATLPHRIDSHNMGKISSSVEGETERTKRTSLNPSETEICLLLCKCLRSLCVCRKSAMRISQAGAVPPLIMVLNHAPPECVQAASSVLVSMAMWQSHLLALHGAIPPLVQMLQFHSQPLIRLSAVQILSQMAIDEGDGRQIITAGAAQPLCALACNENDCLSQCEVGVKTREGALWALTRLSREPLMETLLANDIPCVILSGLSPKLHERHKTKLVREACLILLRNFASIRPPRENHREDSTFFELFKGGRSLAKRAALSVAHLLSADNTEAVRAAAAMCVADSYPRNADRRLVAFGDSDERFEGEARPQVAKVGLNDSLEIELGPYDYVHIVHGSSKQDCEKQKSFEVTPRQWEDAVSARGKVTLRRPGHPDVVSELFSFVLHPHSAALSECGLHALLNVCSEPEVNRHLRQLYHEKILAIPSTLIHGPTARNRILSDKKLELLVLLGQIDLVENNLHRLQSSEQRKKFRRVILVWRKYIGYKALSDIKDQFDNETLRKLQETFAQIDEDGSGYISPGELASFFQQLKMPLTEKQLKEVVNEVDLDGNGCIDFEEFLLVVKNCKSRRKVQSKLGVALQKATALGKISNFIQYAGDSLFASAKKRREKMREDFKATRHVKQFDHNCRIEQDTLRRFEDSQVFKMLRLKIRRRWDRHAQKAFAAAKGDSLKGHVTLDGTFRILAERPSLIGGLGFAHKGMFSNVTEDGQDQQLARSTVEANVDSLGQACKYDTLCRCANDTGIDIRRSLSYSEFQSALWRIICQFRETEVAVEGEQTQINADVDSRYGQLPFLRLLRQGLSSVAASSRQLLTAATIDRA